MNSQEVPKVVVLESKPIDRIEKSLISLKGVRELCLF